MTRVVAANHVETLCSDILQPCYKQKLDYAVKAFEHHFADLPVKYHKPEGAFFMWLWAQGLPISSNELYQRLKQRHVLVIPGEGFFINVDDNWQHKRECLRINYAQTDEVIDRGFAIIADELHKAFA